MSDLLKLQQYFGVSVMQLFQWLSANRYSWTFGEAERTPEQAALYAKEGKGISHSLHCDRLAIDLNIFKDDKFSWSFEAMEPIGQYWESLSTIAVPHCWGGRFTKPDCDHFSVGYQGRK